jgi:hypothetical protein
MTENDSLIDLRNATAWAVAVAVVFAFRQLSTATAWRYYLLVFSG